MKTNALASSHTLANGMLYDDDAAQYLGLKPTTLRDWRCRRRIPQPPYHKIGNRCYYRIEDLDEYIAAQRIEIR